MSGLRVPSTIVRSPFTPFVLFGLACANVWGCATETPGAPVALTFRGMVGDAPFTCGATYEGVGTSGTVLTGYDFRAFVHDLRVVTASGEEIPITLDDDGTWQNGEVALLDFETGSSGCTGNEPTNDRVLGRLPSGLGPEDLGPVTAIRFRLGVPEHLNHLRVATQAAPLNVTSLFWGWSAGYEFLRVDGRTTELPFFTLLLGATGCTGDAMAGTRTCATGNRPDITLPIASLEELESSVIVADLSELFATTDMSRDEGGPDGCMSEASDPECATMFAALGMDLLGGASGEQRFFRLEPR